MMKNSLAILLIFMFSSISHGLSLDGTWVEDKEKTISWERRHMKMDSAKMEIREALLGNIYLKNKNGKGCLFSKPHNFIYKGNPREFTRITTENYNYSIVAKNEFGFVVSRILENGKNSIEMFVFEGDESFYAVSLSTEDFGFPGGRAYFKKTDPVKWDYECKN